MSDVLTPRPVSGRPLETVAAEMLAAFALADGEAVPAEIDLIRAACGEWGIPFTRVEQELAELRVEDAATRFLHCAEVAAVEDRDILAAVLCDVAAADRRLHEIEADLLTALSRAWGVPITFVNRAFNWDAEQLEIIEAPRSARTLVSAGPGMGKTAVACARVSELVEHQHVADANIWLVSFTRSAVTELKTRISDFAEEPGSAVDVKICTIDSQAWRVRYGFTEAQAKTLFGGFETGVEEAVALMQTRREDFLEAFADLDHILIDEAQDITGARARFLLEILNLIRPDCGVTVFHDPAQAIYDYAIDGADPLRFTEELERRLGGDLQHRALRSIHRTDDPVLLRLYEDLRLDILGNADVGPAEFKARADLVRQAAGGSQGRFEPEKVAAYDQSLVLFRRRVEVAQASAFMCGKGLSHRLRMSDLPRAIAPWIGVLFHAETRDEIDQARFGELAAAALGTIGPAALGGQDYDDFVERSWRILLRIAGTGGRSPGVSLLRLRARLAEAPPDDLLLPELGERGPILGTIHGSKGREADHVVLHLGRSWEDREGGRTNHGEESRVLFVGATRAKSRLSVQDGLTLNFASSIDERRSFRPTARDANGAQVQLGLAGDQDLRSIAERPYSIARLVEMALPAHCTAVNTGAPDWHYEIADDDGRWLGRFSQDVNRDLFKLAKLRLKQDGARPPDKLGHLHVIALTTVVEKPGPALIGRRLAAPFDRSGFWVAPLVVGFPTVYCRWGKRG